jgi:hypothetical protein
MVWWATKGASIDNTDGLDGQGVRFGFAGTGGLALDLNFLDPRLARDFDTSIGVNHTYLFAEFTLNQMVTTEPTNVTPLNFSSYTFLFGLALEF